MMDPLKYFNATELTHTIIEGMRNRVILRTGRNCWRICHADKVTFLIDGAAYFRTLYDSLPLAQQQILILSWDIYSQLHLVPPAEAGQYATRLSDLLNQLVHKQSRLHVNILSWDFSLLFALNREWLPVYKLDWSTHGRLSFCLDDQYPLGASHHQKVVVIDDALAFAGGLDLTRGRWDTPSHRADNPRREAVDGEPLPIRPYHDVQLAVAGPIAAALGSLARERWRRATGNKLPVPDRSGETCWPSALASDMENVDVAIVRTAPAFGGYAEVREVEQLYLDSIAAARDYIYIENQYFTAASIAEALAKRLAEPDGPEVILLLPLHVEGWLSQQSMDMMRVSLIGLLRSADKHGRFAVYYPDNSDLSKLSINLHAKVMITDDRLLRVGSANLNNRSMGLDTECDLAIEATHNDARVRNAIHDFRNRLLSEHLACDPEVIDARVRQHGSMRRAIESFHAGTRRLSPLEPRLPEPDERILRDIRLTDPERPVDTDTLLHHFVPKIQAKPAGARIAGWLLTLLLLLALAVAWRFSPLSEWLDISMLSEMVSRWRNASLTPFIVIAAFIFGGLLVMPVTGLIIVVVLVFGPVTGFFYALLGSLMSALSGYGLGTLLGRNMVRRLVNTRINQVSQQLARRGLLTMLVVRIVPVAPFTIINLVAGASHIHFRDFLLGTVLGMIPGILGVTLLTDRVEATVRSPNWISLISLMLVAAVIFTLGYVLVKHLLTQSKQQGNTQKRPPRPSTGS